MEGHNADKNDSTAAESGHRHAAPWMKEKLGLNDEQAKKLDAAWQEHREAVKPLREQLHKALKKIHGVLEIEASDKDIQAALDQVEKARGSLRAETDKHKKIIEALLTPTQRAKMLVMREKMRHHGMKERGHEGGERRGFEGRKDWGHDQEQEQEDE
jgi:Spy/CpxP family protein refolding chaperone